MELSFWGQVGAAVGFVLALIDYALLVGVLAPMLRRGVESRTAEEQAVLERQLARLRWAFLAAFPLFIVLGYYAGSSLG
jgi:hypothetical protein